MREKLTIFGKRRGPYDGQQDSFLYQLVSACSYRDFPLERCNREKQPLINNLVYRWSSIYLFDHHERLLIFLNLFEGSIEEKGRITHTMRQPRIYPISFSVSTSRVWRVYRGLKICFSSRGVVSAPQSPNCSFAMPPHFVFSLQQEK